MAQVAAVIAGRWRGNGLSGNPFRAQLNTDFVLDGYNDLTGQDVTTLPPSPNVYIISALLDDAVLTSVRASSGVLVLWDDSIDIDVPLTANQRNAAITRLTSMGYNAMVAANNFPVGISRREAIRLLVLLFRRAQRG